MAKKRRLSKASKRRLIIFGFVSLVIIIYFFISLATYAFKIVNLTSEKKKLENELIEMKDSEEDLTNEIERLKDPDYLARYARENYSYSKDGEYIIKLDEAKKKEELSSSNSYKKYTMYIGISIICLIFIYIVKKGSGKKKRK